MGGKFIKSRKDILHHSDQFYAVKDEVLRGYLIAFSDQFNEAVRDEIVSIYTDPDLASMFRAYRRVNELRKGFTKKKTMREIIRVPAGHVYEFLRAYFEPDYGPEWMNNRKVLRHPLMRPWWIVSSI